MKEVEGEEEQVSSIHLFGDLQFWLNPLNSNCLTRDQISPYMHTIIFERKKVAPMTKKEELFK